MNTSPFPTAEAQISGLVFAVLLIDRDMGIVQANPAAEDMLGQSAKRLIGQGLIDVVDFAENGVAGKLTNLEARLVARGVRILSAHGARKINLTVSPLVSDPGWRVVTLSDAGQDDMGDDGDAQTALKAPAILAHEIKNPLAAIRGAGQLLARKLDEADRRLTTMILDEVDRIARLIDRMQKLGSTSAELSTAVNLHQSVRKAVAAVRSAADDRVQFEEEFDPSLPAISASADSLEQVLINLLSNAVDACAVSSTPTVTVKTRFVSGLAASISGSEQALRLPIEITVIDTGPGLDPDISDHVFEPFVTSKKNGQGLGLALVKKLVADMGGRVSHKRNELTGMTEFRIHLAIAEQDGT